MSVEVKFYEFAKKKNSTARPVTPIATYNCQLKDNCSVLRPVIKIQVGVLNVTDWNYCRIDDFGRYYFVSDITRNKSVWEISLIHDPLASWKNTIGSQSCYVTRASSDYNGDILDEHYPVRKAPNEASVEPISGGSPWDISDIEDGVFVIGVVGEELSYWVLNQLNLNYFLFYLYTDTFLDDVVDSDWLLPLGYQDLKARLNPIQYIGSIIWFPFDYFNGNYPNTVVTIPVGYSGVSLYAEKLDGVQYETFYRAFTLPNHPQKSTRGSYLNTRPYSEYQLVYPPFGKLELNPDIVSESDSSLGRVETYVYVDMRTGDATLRVTGGSNGTTVLSILNAKVGVNMQISQVMNSGVSLGQLANTAGSIMTGTIGGAIAGGPVGAVAGFGLASISGGASGIGNYVNGKIPTATMIGSRGGVNTLQGAPRVNVINYLLVDEDLTNRGRPLCEVKTLNTLSGYIKTSNANVSISATEEELTMIKNYLEGGFYYE